MKIKVLFVCVENSCRSQMAEGFARALGKDALEAWSAGSKPSGKVNETAVRLMKEQTIDLSHNIPKGLGDLPKIQWDYVVTMGCGDACPIVAAKAKLDWNIPDPKAMPDDEFRKVRDIIEEKVRELIQNAKQKNP
ncbi:MAG: arsenate reductase ArsC [Elusimicrobia bacterium]|nr:arsenate reductase ArsC [Elusimicrobiota bacterium]